MDVTFRQSLIMYRLRPILVEPIAMKKYVKTEVSSGVKLDLSRSLYGGVITKWARIVEMLLSYCRDGIMTHRGLLYNMYKCDHGSRKPVGCRIS